MTSEIGEYKGNPTITLKEGEGKYPFSFGLAKARMILAHVDDIKKFVEEKTKPTSDGNGQTNQPSQS